MPFGGFGQSPTLLAFAVAWARLGRQDESVLPAETFRRVFGVGVSRGRTAWGAWGYAPGATVMQGVPWRCTRAQAAAASWASIPTRRAR